MPNPIRFIAGVPAHRGRRALGALVTALLLAIGFYAYSARNATPAHASTTETGGLNVSINPGSVSVGLFSVSATVTYTCTDTSVTSAQLRVDFDQNGNAPSGETNVACGSADVNITQTISAVQFGMSGNQEVTAVATLDDGDTTATGTADAINRPIFTHIDSTITFSGSGNLNVTGSYNCGSTYTASANLIISASQDTSSSNVAAGDAAVAVSTCNGTNQTFSVTIASQLTGGTFAAGSSAVTIGAGVDVAGTSWMGPSWDWELEF